MKSSIFSLVRAFIFTELCPAAASDGAFGPVGSEPCVDPLPFAFLYSTAFFEFRT